MTSHNNGKNHQAFLTNLKNGSQLTLHAFQGEKIPNSVSVISHTSTTTSSTAVPLIVQFQVFLLMRVLPEAEIVWSAFTANLHLSLHNAALAAELFPKMFPEIFSKMQLGKDKLVYSVTYGLGLYFINQIAKEARSSEFFAISLLMKI